MRFLVILFLCCINAYSQLCESQYLKNYHQTGVELAVAKTSKALDELDQLAGKSASLEEKVAIIEEQYSVFSKMYWSRIEKAKAEIAKQKLGAEKKAKAIKNASHKIMQELSSHPDRMIKRAAEVFKARGIKAEVKKRSLGEETEYLFLEIADSPNAKGISAKKILRYKERFGTEAVTLDFFQNIQNNSAGFSLGKRIDLGLYGMRDLVLDDVVKFVGKHEFHHAAFAAKRANGVGSIYHTQYYAIGEKPLSSVSSIYDKFMSAEEIYNYANNAFWHSSRILQGAKHEMKAVLGDISTIQANLGSNIKIAEQTLEIVKKLRPGIAKMKRELKAGEFEFIILTEKREAARSLDEAYEFVLIDEKNQILVHEFIGPEYRADIKKILEVRKKLEAKYTGMDGEKKELQRMAIKEENALGRKSYLNVLDAFESKQNRLAKVAAELKAETEVAQGMTDDLVDRMVQAIKKDQDNFKKGEWLKEIRLLGQDYRRLGNLVKEDYKGFAGR